MDKNSIIIVGGSPFVNEVDFKKIDFDKYDILCINRPILNAPVKYLCCHDTDFRACHTQQEVQDTLRKGLNPVFIAPKTEFIHETTGWNWKFDMINTDKNTKLLGFCLYSCTSAVNFAYLKDYKNVYLVGIDLKEDNKPFTHWHGVVNTLNVATTSAKKTKEYIYQFKKWLNIYQTNSEVKDIWDVKYCPIKKLYKNTAII